MRAIAADAARPIRAAPWVISNLLEEVLGSARPVRSWTVTYLANRRIGGWFRESRREPAFLSVRRAALGEAHSFLSGAEEGAGFMLAFLVLGFRHGVRDDPGAGLDVHDLVLHHRGAEHDAGV